MLNQELYGTAHHILQHYKDGQISREDFLAMLETLFPFNHRSLRKESWTVIETTLSYYRLDCDGVLELGQFYLNDLLKPLDEEKIFELLSNCSNHKIFNYGEYVILKELISFFKEKHVPIPEHLNSLEVRNVGLAVVPEEQLTPTKPREQKMETLRIEASRITATIIWKKERKEMEVGKRKKLSTPSELSRNKHMIKIIKSINEAGDIKPVQGDEHSESGVDVEWYSHLYPDKKA